MRAYKINNKGIATNIKKVKFNKERDDLQKVVEENLETIFNLKLVKSEFKIKNRRIDTLAFDEETKSFVIIEYKIDKYASLIDQGLSYLEKLLNNFGEFEIEYSRAFDKVIKHNEIDKSQTRVMFISPSYTERQLEATSFKDLPLELWKATKFNNGTIVFEEIDVSSNKESFGLVLNSNTKNKDNNKDKEVKVYDEEDHLNNKSQEIQDLYENLKERILAEFEDIKIVPQKHYIAYKYEKNNVISVEILSKELKIFVGMKEGTIDIDDEKLKINTKGHFGTGEYEYRLRPDDDIFQFLSIFSLAYEDKVNS